MATLRAFSVRFFSVVRPVGTLPSAFLCRALSWDFAVQGFVVVRYFQTLPCGVSLPCVLLAAHGKDVFAVQRRTAMIGCTAMPFFPVVTHLDR
jgi:hypothetical protein